MPDASTFQPLPGNIFDNFGGVGGGIIRPILLEQQGRQTVAEDGVTITAATASATSRAYMPDASVADAQLYGVEVGTKLAWIPATELSLTPRTNDKVTATDTGEIWFVTNPIDPTGAKTLWMLALSRIAFKQ